MCSQCGTHEDWFDDPMAMYPVRGRCRGCQLIEMDQAMVPEKEKGVQIALFPDLDRESGRLVAMQTSERDD